MPSLPQLIETSSSPVAANHDKVVNPSEPVPNIMQFVQTDDMSYFLMDESITYADPDPPKLNATVYFNLGGLWTQPVEIDHINIKCHIFGALVFNEDFPDVESVQPGGWTYTLPFDVPPIAPDTTFYNTIIGVAQDGTSLFTIETNFRF